MSSLLSLQASDDGCEPAEPPEPPAATRSCPHCGQPIKGAEQFCGQCGTPVEGDR